MLPTLTNESIAIHDIVKVLTHMTFKLEKLEETKL